MSAVLTDDFVRSATVDSPLWRKRNDHPPSYQRPSLGKNGRIKALAFDLDNTLTYADWYWYSAWKQIAHEELGFHLTRRQWLSSMMNLWGDDVASEIERSSGAEFEPGQRQGLVRVATARALQNTLQSGPRRGVVEILQQAHSKRIPVGIVTNGPWAWLRRTLPQNLWAYFERPLIVTNDDTAGRVKPYPDGWLMLADRLGLPPAAILGFDNTPDGVRSLVLAGMYSCATPCELTIGAPFGMYDVKSVMSEVDLFSLVDALRPSPVCSRSLDRLEQQFAPDAPALVLATV